MLGKIFKKSTIFILCLFALFLFLGMTYSDTKESQNKPPEWSKKSYWKDDQNFYAVGIHSGHFVNEQDAYFSALRELAQYMSKYIYGLQKDNENREESAVKLITKIELAGIIKCSSMKKEYHEVQKNYSDVPSSKNKGNLSEVYSSEYKEFPNGLNARYYMSAIGDNYHMEMAYDCSTKDISKTLKRIPIVDTYIGRKDGTVTTYVLIKYPEKYLKDLAKDESMQKSLKEAGD